MCSQVSQVYQVLACPSLHRDMEVCICTTCLLSHSIGICPSQLLDSSASYNNFLELMGVIGMLAARLVYHTCTVLYSIESIVVWKRDIN